jgi:hypothetical protein
MAAAATFHPNPTHTCTNDNPCECVSVSDWANADAARVCNAINKGVPGGGGANTGIVGMSGRV